VYAVVVFIMAVFGVRLFYLQVIRHDYYVQAAQSDQLKEYEITPTRGIIKAHDGSRVVPIVLNQKLYTLYADPTLVKDSGRVAETLAASLGGTIGDYENKLDTPDTRYVVLAKKLNQDQKEKILRHKYPGVGASEQFYRTHPNGVLAAQLLGFVNGEGKGAYGIEQALNKELDGTPGRLKAITDINGVPLAANKDNTLVPAISGDDVLLTVDVAMQKQLETILQQGLEAAKAESGSALIMDPTSGAILAMANLPTYNPDDYAAVEDSKVFNNAAVSDSLEVGSVMKPLTVAAALDLGVVKVDTSYFDPSVWEIDDYKIKNVEEDGGAGQHTIGDILSLSLNTGATWLLMQMSDKGGTEVNKQGRQRWYEYATNHYRLGQATGIEQGYEDEGYMPEPDKGYGLNLTYANTVFGQGMRATPLQMAAAFSAIVNGGTYYQPRLVDQLIAQNGKVTTKKPVVLRSGVVSDGVSRDIRGLLNNVIAKRQFKRRFDLNTYSVGGKTGTAEIAKPGGGYFDNQFNGMYVGFVGGDMPQYVITVRVNQPKIGGYAGTVAAQPIFAEVVHMLIDDFGVTPKGR